MLIIVKINKVAAIEKTAIANPFKAKFFIVLFFKVNFRLKAFFKLA